MFNIAIDGPSASGKSSIAKALARELGFIHIDTGAMYRSVAYACLKNQVSLDSEKFCSEIAKAITLDFNEDGEILLNGENVDANIRHDRISKAASLVSKHENVRKVLVDKQRTIASSKGFILDGRDIGSVVLPDAELKIFQIADPRVRAQRRYEEFREQGREVDFETIYQDLLERDYQDSNREHSPLIKVEDAIEIDTTLMSIQEVVDLIMNLIESRGLK